MYSLGGLSTPGPTTSLVADRYTLINGRHRYALLRKRAAYFRRDTKTWVFTFCLPALFVLVGLLLIKVRHTMNAL